MQRYDPELAPISEDWLTLDEDERIVLVEAYHRNARIRLPKSRRTVHASFHVIVENQLAEQDETVTQALGRLMAEGLSRHEALHAIGSVVAEEISSVLKHQKTPDPTHARYHGAIAQLTAASWRALVDD